MAVNLVVDLQIKLKKEEEFENILTNEPIFDGWDCDIILPDFKIAITLNGIWHYKKNQKTTFS